MTFQKERNTASALLDEAGKVDGLPRQHKIDLASAHIALAQAEAHHELASGLNALAGAIARWQR